jgi:predicted ATPase
MLTQINLTNFKCFKDGTNFPLSRLNLLTGINGRGKSTLLQSLLLMRQSVENNKEITQILLNGSCVNLGNFDDIRNSGTSKKESIIFKYDFWPEEFNIEYKDCLDEKSALENWIKVKLNLYDENSTSPPTDAQTILCNKI